MKLAQAIRQRVKAKAPKCAEAGAETGTQSGTEPKTKADEAKPKAAERLIPFVSVYVDKVDLAARRITVDWQTDY